MSFNPAGCTAVPLQVFGSWVTEMQPDALPEGVSPDNQDMVFVPGGTGARPALQRVFVTPFPAGGPGNIVPTVVSSYSFRLPTGSIQNFYFDSNGVLWIEYFSAIPGARNKLFTSISGTFCKFLSAGGHLYIAISDGQHGADVPLQWDGANLDRVSQDGPAAAPTVASIIIPPTTLVANVLAPQTITSITSSSPTTTWDGPSEGYVTIWTQITVTLQAGSTVPPQGTGIVISGNAIPAFNTAFTVYAATGALTFTCYFWQAVSNTGAGGTATPNTGVTLQRNSNIVSATTSAAHGLQPGYQAQISGMDSAIIGGGIASVIIDNETNPGIAVVTTNDPHGLVPLNQITMTDIGGAIVGGFISSVLRAGQISQVTTTTPHGLSVGSEVIVECSTAGNSSFNGQFTVLNVIGTDSFSYYQFDADVTTTADSGTGTVAYLWPIVATGPAPNYFQVQTAPTALTFTVSISYTDGTWTGGNIGFAWDGTFYVATTPTVTTFTYQQYGPNASSTIAGTVTPYGQCAPGIHLCRMSFLTRQGQQTRPSPWFQWEAPGGQYVSVTAMLTGPSNIVARILEFTGASGNFFFWIPQPAQVNGQVVSTSTIINDNVSTSALLDFGDPTLYTGLATSAPTYNTPSQIVLDGALGFLYYKQRLHALGMRNNINNLLNLGFNGGGNLTVGFGNGYYAPPGWTTNIAVGANASLQIAPNGRPGWAAQFVGPFAGIQTLSQSAYEDGFGAPILEGNTTYTLRAYVDLGGSMTAQNLYASLTSASTGFSAPLSIPIANGFSGFVSAAFSLPTPVAVPNDLMLNVGTNNQGSSVLYFNEISVSPQQSPYLDTILASSYLNAPEQFNGVTGFGGPPDDVHKLLDGAVIRNTLYMLTQDPEGRLHEVSAGNTEPSGWEWDEVDSACGLMSAFALTKSQADNRTSSGGEEWFAWASQSGPRIFGGGIAHKIGQEIQSAWYDPVNNQTWPQINFAASNTIWAHNDPATRTIMFGLPLGAATAPSVIYPLNYRELDSAEAIAASPPFHPSFAGRLIATDNTRKWTRWNVTANFAASMYRSVAGGIGLSSQLSTVICGGNAQAYGAAPGYGNVYTLNPEKYTDDDYGQINPYYVTAALPTVDQEQALQLDAGRKQVEYITWQAQGIGMMTVESYSDALTNLWPLNTVRNLSTSPSYDAGGPGGNTMGERIFWKFSSSPLEGETDNTFFLRKVNIWYKKAKLNVRGTA